MLDNTLIYAYGNNLRIYVIYILFIKLTKESQVNPPIYTNDCTMFVVFLCIIIIYKKQ